MPVLPTLRLPTEPLLTATTSLASGRDSSVGELLVSVGVLVLLLVAWFVIWRWRRLKLRIGDSAIEYFPQPPPEHGDDGSSR